MFNWFWGSGFECLVRVSELVLVGSGFWCWGGSPGCCDFAWGWYNIRFCGFLGV